MAQFKPTPGPIRDARVLRPGPAPDLPPELPPGTEIPRKRFKGSARLCYKSLAAPDLNVLDTVTGPCAPRAFNVSVCLDNAISIWQTSADRNAVSIDEWRIRYEFSQLDSPTCIPIPSVGPNALPGLRIRFRTNSPPCISSENSTVPPKGGIIHPREYPINVQSKRGESFSCIQLDILKEPVPADRHQTIEGEAQDRVVFNCPNILHLLSGQFPTSQLEDINTWYRWNMRALEKEQAEARSAMKDLRGCTANIRPFTRNPNPSLAHQNQQMELVVNLAEGDFVDLENLPEVYEIRGPPNGIFDPTLAEDNQFPIANRAKTDRWEGAVTFVSRSRRVMHLVVLNDTHRNYNHFGIGGVPMDLIHIFHDPVYDYAREGIQVYYTAVSRIDMNRYRAARANNLPFPIIAAYEAQNPRETFEQRQHHGNLVYSLPIPSILLRSHPAITCPHPAPIAPLITTLSSLATDAQWQAVVDGLTNVFTMIRGAAGTGKSLTLAILIHQFIANRPGGVNMHQNQKKILYTSPTNQGADVGFAATVALFRKYGLDMPFCRYYSDHRVEQDYLLNQWQHWGWYHIENQRLRLAQADGTHYFTNAVDTLKRDGRIQDPLELHRYKRERARYTEIILRQKLVVFTSCIGAHHVLKPEWHCAEAFQPKMLIVDEYWSAKPYDLAIPVARCHTLDRIVVAGDPQQLSPVIRDDTVRRVIWPLTIAQEMTNRRFPTNILNIQYRAHSRLYQPISQEIYGGIIQSHSQYNADRVWLHSFRRHLPISFPDPQERGHYHLTEPIHFLHVHGGMSRERGTTSTENELQAKLADALVRRLIEVDGVHRSDITVVSPYGGQTRLVKDLAEENDWLVEAEGNVGPRGNVITTDSSQGSENNIIIFCLTRSGQNLDFVGNPSRANVALSRAKEALYVIGDWIWLQSLPSRNTNKLLRMLAAYRQNVGPQFVVRPVANSLAEKPNAELRRIAQAEVSHIRQARARYEADLARRQARLDQYAPDHQWPDRASYIAAIPREPIPDRESQRLEDRLNDAIRKRT